MTSRKTTMRAAAGLAVAAMIAAPAPALAHDSLAGSSPEGGAAAAEAPGEIELSFSAPPQDVGLEIRVTGPDGTDVTDGDPQIEGSAAIQELSDAAQAPGEYSVVWRVVSSDGHPIEGAYDYTVEGEGASGGASETASDEAAGGPSETAADEQTGAQESSAAPQDGASGSDSDESTADSSSDTAEDQGPGTAVWLMIGGGIVVLGAVAAAVVMMRRMGR